MSYKEVMETTTTYPDLDEEDKKYLRRSEERRVGKEGRDRR